MNKPQAEKDKPRRPRRQRDTVINDLQDILTTAVESVGGVSAAAKLYKTSGAAIRQLLGYPPGTGNLRIGTAADLLDALGYDLCVGASARREKKIDKPN